MLKMILILTGISILFFGIASLLMFFSKGVRVKGAHARGEHKRLDKAKAKLKRQRLV